MTATTATDRAPVHVRDTVDAAGLDLTSLWDRLPKMLRQTRTPDLTRTSNVSLREWSIPAETRPASVTVPMLVKSGVCLDDLVSWCRIARLGKGNPSLVAGFLAMDLHRMRTDWPDMSLRDALGWLLLGASSTPRADARLLARTWGSPPPSGAWFHAAAGLAPGEVSPAGTGRALDEDTVRALVALRGTTLPAN